MHSCINAGVDAPNHLMGLDDDGVKVLLAKKLPYVPTVDDLIALEKGDLSATDGRNSRLKMLEEAVRRAVAANVPIVFGSGGQFQLMICAELLQAINADLDGAGVPQGDVKDRDWIAGHCPP
jgi:hypothetical protein